MKNDTLTTRSMLKAVILGMDFWIENSNNCHGPFREYAVFLPFARIGFHFIKQMDEVAADYGIPKSELKGLLETSNNADIVAKFKNYRDTKLKMKFYAKNMYTKFKNLQISFAFWQYSRLFEGRCLVACSVPNNADAVMYCIALLPTSKHTAKDMYSLRNYVDNWQVLLERGQAVRAQKKMLAVVDPLGLPPPVEDRIPNLEDDMAALNDSDQD